MDAFCSFYGGTSCEALMLGIDSSLDASADFNYEAIMDLILSKADILRRRAEVNRDMDNTRKRLSELQNELSELEAAEHLLVKFGHAAEEEAVPAPKRREAAEFTPVVTGISLPNTERVPPLRELILRALRQAGSGWLTAGEIQRAASEMKGSDVPMGSISPTLTALKNEGLIARDGMKVALKENLMDLDL
jgi:BMFP domain-containing protein YqiC